MSSENRTGGDKVKKTATKPDRSTVTIGAQFDKTTHAQIQAIARAEERSIANVVRLALKQYIGNRIREI